MTEQITEKQQREFYRWELNVHFGHLEKADVLKAMQLVRKAHVENLPLNELDQQLSDRLLIVPGSNIINVEQLTVLLQNYWLDPELWHKRIQAWEAQGGS